MPQPVSSAELNRRLAEARRQLQAERTRPPQNSGESVQRAAPAGRAEPAAVSAPLAAEPAQSADLTAPLPRSAAADTGATRLPRDLRRSPRALIAVGLLLVVLIASAAAFIVSRQSNDEPGADRSPAARQQPSRGSPVLAWLADNTAPGTSVLVPNALLDRARDRLPDRAVRGYYQLGAERRPDLLVTRPELGNLGEPLRGAAASAPVVASLGHPTWQVRDMNGGASAEAGVRQEVGRELLENPALTFSDTARAALLDGNLDSRLLVLLSGLATQADVLVDLPAGTSTSPTVPGRALWIRSIDGEDAAASTVGRVTVNYFVTTQKGPLAATAGLLTAPNGESVLAIRVPLPSPTGLLGGDDMPTTG